jgi:hypothetical protein
VVFISNGEIATANAGSNDITIFQLQGDLLNNGTSYQLPQGSLTPLSIAYSPSGSFLATADGNSRSITLFTVTNQTAGNAASYALPANSTDCISITSSPPIGNSGALCVATANGNSGDVTLLTFFGQPSSDLDSTGTNNGSPISIIVGATVGAVALAGLTVATVIGAFILYKHLHKKYRKRMVNISLSSASGHTVEQEGL